MIKTLRTWKLHASVHFSDMSRYLRYSRTLNVDSSSKLLAAIIEKYHVLEKALSFTECKEMFGKDAAESLIALLGTWAQKSYCDNIQIEAAYGALYHYFEHIGESNVVTLKGHEEILKKLKEFECMARSLEVGGVNMISGDKLKSDSKGDFASLVSARRSIRDYANEPVTDDLISRGVELAQLSPSVCNRQSSHVFYAIEPSRIESILSLQNGNRGFGVRSKAVIIVTSDISVFTGTKERNQSYIDGGLFAMSLMYALSYLGLGACPLNWCVNPDRDMKLKRLTGIPDSHNIIMLIAAGHIPESLLIAKSCRFNVAEVLRKIA